MAEGEELDPTVSEFVGSNLREREEPGSNFPQFDVRIGSDSGPKGGNLPLGSISGHPDRCFTLAV